MEIPARLFFMLWALIGAGSLCLGIITLDKTDLPTLISPVILSFFKHSFAVFASTSSGHALVVRPKLTDSVGRHYYVSFAVFPILFSRTAQALGWRFSVYDSVAASLNVLFWAYFAFDQLLFLLIMNFAFNPLLPLLFNLSQKIADSLVLMIFISQFAALAWVVARKFCRGERFRKLFFFDQLLLLLIMNFALLPLLFNRLLPLLFNLSQEIADFLVLMIFISQFAALAWVDAWKFCRGERFRKLFCRNELFQKWLFTAAGAVANRILSKKTMRDLGGVIGFPISLAAAILFQYFFRSTSFDHVVVFLLFAVAWLSNLALLMWPHDFGIFNFLLSNVIVGTALNQLGNLKGTAWLAYGACLLLHGVRVMLKSMSLVKRGEKEVVVLEQSHYPSYIGTT